jgi:CrcB protein
MRFELQVFLVALGGAIGALGRFGITAVAYRYARDAFPVGTLIANVLGCFLIGVMIGSGSHMKYHQVRLAVGIGLLGSLTTFSTFGAETIHHLNNGQWFLASLNVVANLALGFLAVAIGMALGQKLVK